MTRHALYDYDSRAAWPTCDGVKDPGGYRYYGQEYVCGRCGKTLKLDMDITIVEVKGETGVDG